MTDIKVLLVQEACVHAAATPGMRVEMVGDMAITVMGDASRAAVESVAKDIEQQTVAG